MVGLVEDQRRAGAILASALTRAAAEIAPGVRVEQICNSVLRTIIDLGGEPVFCAAGSDSEVLVEVDGVSVRPAAWDRFDAGSLVTIDAGCRYGGWCADAARTWRVPEADASSRGEASEVDWLVRRVRQALLRATSWMDVRADVIDGAVGCWPGWYVELTGHGIGRELHQDPILTGESSVRLADYRGALAVELTVRRSCSIDGTAAAKVEVIRLEETVWLGDGSVEILTRGRLSRAIGDGIVENGL